MAILTDGTHLVSDESDEELHEFAAKLGLKRRWYQDKASRPHYDLMSRNAVRRAIDAGAILVTGRELLRRMA